MKIKAKLEKFSRLVPQSIPCSVLIRAALRKGKSVEVDEKLAVELLAMNIVKKVKTKTKKSKGVK